MTNKQFIYTQGLKVIIEASCSKNPRNRMRANRNDRSPAMDKIADVSSTERTASDLVRMLRKLRWMGMENEPEWMEVRSALNRLVPGDSVLGAPCDTD